MEMNKYTTGFLGALGMILLISVTIWIVNPTPLVRYVLIFPDTAGGDLHHEIRELPRRNIRIDTIELFLEELILGPSDIGAIPFMPLDTEILGTFLSSDRIAFVNLSDDVLFSNGGETPVDDITNLLEKNLLFNFRFLNGVTVTIDGQVPGFPPINKPLNR